MGSPVALLGAIGVWVVCVDERLIGMGWGVECKWRDRLTRTTQTINQPGALLAANVITSGIALQAQVWCGAVWYGVVCWTGDRPYVHNCGLWLVFPCMCEPILAQRPHSPPLYIDWQNTKKEGTTKNSNAITPPLTDYRRPSPSRASSPPSCF